MAKPKAPPPPRPQLRTGDVVWAPGTPGYTSSHVDAMGSICRGFKDAESVAEDTHISDRLAQALIEDLIEGPSILAVK